MVLTLVIHWYLVRICPFGWAYSGGGQTCQWQVHCLYFVGTLWLFHEDGQKYFDMVETYFYNVIGYRMTDFLNTSCTNPWLHDSMYMCSYPKHTPKIKLKGSPSCPLSSQVVSFLACLLFLIISIPSAETRTTFEEAMFSKQYPTASATSL